MSTENTEIKEEETEPAEHVHGPGCNHGHEAIKPMVRSTVKVGRNDPCPCGSKKKHKKCCG
jgi:uncharacterized protein YecA (UPF0149 family)